MATRSQLRTLLLLLIAWTCIHPLGVQAIIHDSERQHLQQRARDMFYHGYNNYLTHAYPWDELQPLSCSGRRWDQRSRGDIDDVLGGFSLTLIDSLDTLAVLGDRDEFARAVQLVISDVTFDRDITVSLFETTIRVVGGLVSAHVLASPSHIGMLSDDEYDGELLGMANELALRLLPAFDTPTGIPVHRVNLRHGLVDPSPRITCPAAAGSLLVELSYLSRLTGNSIFEAKARQAVTELWSRRSSLNLLGSAIDVYSGKWTARHSSIGAGVDSFFEYLLKYHLLSGDTTFEYMFNASYHAVEEHMRHSDFHFEVDMAVGRPSVRSLRVSALQAFWPGLQVLAGDVSSAVRSHDNLFGLWDRFGAMPELFDLNGKGSVVEWARTSPLRPELIESTYHLYQATRDPKYLKIGRKILEDIEMVSKVPCGYAGIKDIQLLTIEDRMDSFVLSETAKYLYLLFSDEPDVVVPSVNVSYDETSRLRSRPLRTSEVLFSTEGHLFPIDHHLFPQSTSEDARSSIDFCENGNLVANRVAKGRNVKASTSFRQRSVSVRAGDSHLMTMVASPGNFGLQVNESVHVEAPLVFPSKAIGNACRALSRTNKEIVRGRFVMVRRGQCSFVEKALTLQRAGAAGVILINNKDIVRTPSARPYLITDDGYGRGKLVTIPLVMVYYADARDLIRRSSLASSEEEITAVISAWLH